MQAKNIQWREVISRVCTAAKWYLRALLNSVPLAFSGNSTRNHIGALRTTSVYDLINAGTQHRFRISGWIALQSNFGLLYGMGAEGYRIYAETAYGVKMSESEAEDNRNKFFNTYQRLIPWHGSCKSFAHEHGYISTPLGRVRHLPLIKSPNGQARSKAERNAVNCVTEDTKILTVAGWKSWGELTVGDLAFSLNPETGLLEHSPIEAINSGLYEGDMYCWEAQSFRAMTTPDHRWLVRQRNRAKKYGALKFTSSKDLKGGPDVVIPVAAPSAAPDSPEFTDADLSLLGWFSSDGFFPSSTVSKVTGLPHANTRIGICQKKPHNVEAIRNLLAESGYPYKESTHSLHEGYYYWHVQAPLLKTCLCAKGFITVGVIASLSTRQAGIVLQAIVAGDGSVGYGKTTIFAETEAWAESLVMLATLAGINASVRVIPPGTNAKVYPSIGYRISSKGGYCVTLRRRDKVHPQYGKSVVTGWSGTVWCPTLRHGNFVAMRQGSVFITGNSPVQGTLSDMSLWATAIYKQEYGMETAPIVLMVHDNLVMYAPTEDAKMWGLRLREIMSTLPFHKFDWHPQVTFDTDFQIGPNLAELADVE